MGRCCSAQNRSPSSPSVWQWESPPRGVCAVCTVGVHGTDAQQGSAATQRYASLRTDPWHKRCLHACEHTRRIVASFGARVAHVAQLGDLVDAEVGRLAWAGSDGDRKV